MTSPPLAGPTEARREVSPWWGLLLHGVVIAGALTGAFLLNARWLPEHAWSRWLAIGWGVVFFLHLLYVVALGLASLGGHNPT